MFVAVYYQGLLVAWVARFKVLWELLEKDCVEEIQKVLFAILPDHQSRWIKGLAFVVYAYSLVSKAKKSISY
jgi:hypothetical protein